MRAFSSEADLLPTRYTHFIDQDQELKVPAAIAPVMSLDNMNSKQTLATKKKEMIDQFQMHHADTGSSQVQSKSHMCATGQYAFMDLFCMTGVYIPTLVSHLIVLSCCVCSRYFNRENHKFDETFCCTQKG